MNRLFLITLQFKFLVQFAQPFLNNRLIHVNFIVHPVKLLIIRFRDVRDVNSRFKRISPHLFVILLTIKQIQRPFEGLNILPRVVILKNNSAPLFGLVIVLDHSI